MNKCVICGNPITQDEPPILYHSDITNSDVLCCAKCEKQLDNLLKSEDTSIVRKAVNYFYTYTETVTDREAKSFLKQLVEDNASAVIELEQQSRPLTTKQIAPKQKDYFASQSYRSINDNTSDGWITCMKVIAWIVFCAIIVSGIILAQPYFHYSSDAGIGIAIVLLSIVIAVSVVGGVMIFLGVATDIRIIRRKMESSKKGTN